MIKKVKILSFFLIAGFLVWTLLLPKEIGSKNQAFLILKKGQSTRDIAYNLQKQGLIKSGRLFRVYTLTLGVSNQLQAGVYKLSPSMNLLAIAKRLAEGDTTKETLTIIEGWSLKDIGGYLGQKGIGPIQDFWKITGSLSSGSQDFSPQFAFLKEKPKNVSLEGYLFPDTYEVEMASKPEEIIVKMLGNFDKKITEDLRNEIKRQDKTLFDVLTVASLIEKEVKTYADKQVVSGIFWKRLKAGVALNSCASIAYILGVDKWVYSYDDTKTPSPYNTYLNRGLPLGPIANPGLESIKAALYSKDSAYWYWLSAPDGQTIFSKTLEEHNAAKVKYLK